MFALCVPPDRGSFWCRVVAEGRWPPHRCIIPTRSCETHASPAPPARARWGPIEHLIKDTFAWFPTLMLKEIHAVSGSSARDEVRPLLADGQIVTPLFGEDSSTPTVLGFIPSCGVCSIIDHCGASPR